MTAYDASEWTDLFVAAAGAGAALAGLVFVAVSINIKNILEFAGLPERALETVVTLLIVVVVSIACLVPGQSHVALGIELLLITGVYVAFLGRLTFSSPPPGKEPPWWLTGRIMLRVIATVPFIVGALSVLAETGGGLYWIAAGIAGAIVAAVTNAWVLLVEILR